MIRAQEDACGSALRYYIDGGDAGACSAHKTAIYVPGSAIDTPKETYPHNANPCAFLDRANSPALAGSYYEAVPSAPAEWVELTEDVEPVTDSLAVVSWRASDGTRIPNRLRLLPGGEACDSYPFLFDAMGADTRCVPTLRARAGDGFDNDRCSGEPLAASCGPTGVVESKLPESDLPGPPPKLFETGAVVSPVYFRGINDLTQCTTLPSSWTSPPNQSVFYELGPALSLDKYPVLSLLKVGTERLQIEYLTSAGKNLLVNSYFDTKYGMQCTPTKLADGGTWCVPGTIQFLPDNPNLFADAECTRPLVDWFPGPDEMGLATPKFRFGLAFPPGSSCNPKLAPTLVSIVDYSGATYQRLSTSQCSWTSGPNPDVHYFEVGAPVDPREIVVPVPHPP